MALKKKVVPKESAKNESQSPRRAPKLWHYLFILLNKLIQIINLFFRFLFNYLFFFKRNFTELIRPKLRDFGFFISYAVVLMTSFGISKWCHNWDLGDRILSFLLDHLWQNSLWSNACKSVRTYCVAFIALLIWAKSNI